MLRVNLNIISKLIVITFLLISISVSSQTNAEYRREKAKIQINELKHGYLLVRLRILDNALKDVYKPDTALVIKKLEYENRIIISAFKNKFNFCKLAFFYDSYTTSIANREFLNVFVNNELKIDSSIVINDSLPIFIADFGKTGQNPINGGMGSYSIFSLNIKDYEFVQLTRPFPYYVKTLRNFQNKTSNVLLKDLETKSHKYYITVDNMNEKLNLFYNKYYN